MGYWTDSVNYLKSQDQAMSIPDLFAALDAEKEGEVA